MNEKLSMYLSKITGFFKKLDKKKRNLYLTVFGVSLAAAVILTLVLNYTDYVVLYRNLDIEECAEIAEKLDEMSVKYKVENESTIYVDKKKEPQIKLKLASEGYPKSSLNYDIFTTNIDFMTTDFEKNQYKLFQLQERLQASIKTLDDVKDAIVTITVPDNSLAVLDDDKVDPSASVLLTLKNNVTLSDDQIRGIEQLVAKSVPGLSVENISIVDQTGAILNGETDPTVASTSGKIKTENEISKLYENRIMSILSPIYGKKNISIGVNVVLDYSKKITEKTEYIPSQGNAGVIKSYDQTYQGTGGGANNGGVPGTEPNTEVPGYTVPDNNEDNGAVSNKVSVDYLVNQVKEQVQKEGAELKDITISVVIDKNNMTVDEQDKVIGIIANSTGISRDKVALFNTEFTAAREAEAAADKTPRTPGVNLLSTKYLLLYGGVALLLIAGILIFAMIRSRRKERALEDAELMAAMQQEDEKFAKQIEKPIDFEFDIAELTENKENHLVSQIREFSLRNPQITAQILRTMLKGDTD